MLLRLGGFFNLDLMYFNIFLGGGFLVLNWGGFLIICGLNGMGLDILGILGKIKFCLVIMGLLDFVVVLVVVGFLFFFWNFFIIFWWKFFDENELFFFWFWCLVLGVLVVIIVFLGCWFCIIFEVGIKFFFVFGLGFFCFSIYWIVVVYGGGDICVLVGLYSLSGFSFCNSLLLFFFGLICFCFGEVFSCFVGFLLENLMLVELEFLVDICFLSWKFVGFCKGKGWGFDMVVLGVIGCVEFFVIKKEKKENKKIKNMKNMVEKRI